MKLSSRSAFTLIELLIVIAIIAILAVVVVLTLNPAALLQQSRDSNRLSDLSTMNDAINFYNTDQAGSASYSLGTASTTYLSISDPAATSTAGTNCGTMGLPATPTGWTDQCAASSTLRLVNGMGWIPVNFSNISSGIPFGTLPIDPVNNTSSLLYYTYATNGLTYEFTAPLESQKYLKQDLLISNTDPARQAVGSNSNLISQEEGLVGYWNFDEGNGLTANDTSGNSNNGTWNGTATGASGYYSPGKVGPWAGTFDGTSTYIDPYRPNLNLNSLSSLSISAWIDPKTIAGTQYMFMENSPLQFELSGNKLKGCIYTNTAWVCSLGTVSLPVNSWSFITTVYNGQNVSLYENGVFDTSAAQTGLTPPSNGCPEIGRSNNGLCGSAVSSYFSGFIDDVRIYNRSLSAAEIQEIYNAEK